MLRLARSLLVAALAVAPVAPVAAQQPQPDPSRLTVARIWASPEFASERPQVTRWLERGKAYTALERAPGGRGTDLVRYDVATGAREVLVPASRLVAPGDTAALDIEEYQWSPDLRYLLLFTNAQPVWRFADKGDYWLLDRQGGTLRRVGGPGVGPAALRFAKFSPDGKRIGYIRDFDLYTEDVVTGEVVRLTTDGSRAIINGAFDWVYEEEFSIRDGWRWSPDSRTIAYWQLDANGVKDFFLINNTDSLYARPVPIQYPKAGETNSAARIGVVRATGGPTTWLRIDGDLRNQYLARMDWAASGSELWVQKLNRRQDQNELLLADAATGAVRPILLERMPGWTEVVEEVTWLAGGSAFLWLSERDGWNHVYRVSRDGKRVQLLTPGEYDVADIASVDETGGYLYFRASPGAPAQRYLWRVRLDGRGKPERVTPLDQPGTHSYDVAPDGSVAWHTVSRADVPPRTELVRLPKHDVVRVVAENARLRERLAALRRGTWDTLSVAGANGALLRGYVHRPPDFDPSKRYPVLFHVYGGPNSQTVLDSWGGPNYLWHAMLTQKGVVVVSVDGRGTGQRGADWRRAIYGQLGVEETRDLVAAARSLGRLPWVDAARIGIWGWSYGGFMTLNALLQEPGVFRMGIAVAPVTHWALYDNIYTERYNGLPAENRDGYNRGSPLSYAQNLRGDLLMVHGTGDDNVHVQNSEMMIDALVAANRPFRYFAYPNRNHGIFGGNTRRHLYEMMTEFVEEKLVGR